MQLAGAGLYQWRMTGQPRAFRADARGLGSDQQGRSPVDAVEAVAYTPARTRDGPERVGVPCLGR